MSEVAAAFLVELGCDPSQLRSGLRRGVADARTAGDAAGNAFGIGFNNRLLNAVAGVGDLLRGAKESLRFAGIVSGSQVAAEFGQYRRQLQFIAGDANKAEAAFRSLQKTAQTSNFDTGQVAQFGVNLAGRTGDVAGAARQVQQVVDAAQVSGVQNQDFGAFQTNLKQIQNRGANKVERPDLEQLKNYAPILSTAIAKAYGISIADASKKIENASGNELSNMILELGKRNAGAAAGASGSDPFQVAANTVDSFNSAMEPTGRIVNAALLPLAQGALWLTQQFGALNSATGGSAGLIAIVGVGTIAIQRMAAVAREKIIADKSEASALRDVAGAATLAATSLRELAGVARIKSGIDKTSVIADIAARANAAKGLSFGRASSSLQTAFARGGLQGVGRVASVVAKGTNVAKIAGGVAAAGVPILLDLGLNALGTNLKGNKDPRKQGIGDVLSATGTGIGIGALVGSFVPVIGTVVGGVVGGLVGAVAGSVQAAMRGDEKSGGSAADRTARATEDAAKSLKDMKTKQIGGGERMSNALRGLEYEHAITRSASTGFA